MTLSTDEKVKLLEEVGEEIIELDELRDMIQWKVDNNKQIFAYDGFEPSGDIHIAQGLLRTINVNKLTKCGIKFIFLLADWHAAANQKFDGDLNIIKKVADFFIEVWKVCGMDLDNVEFRYASDLVKDPDYWEMVLKIGINTTLKRVKRCTQIMGRSEADKLYSSQILYPLMQCADIFYLSVDICQLGLDQRKVNMLAREVSNLFKRPKPISIHHHMLMGLKKPPDPDLDAEQRAKALKMSKSDKDSAIFMLDSPDDVNRKINKAHCPNGNTIENPILEYCKYILFELYDKFLIERKEEHGGNVEYNSYNKLEEDFAKEKLHSKDLKKAVAKYLNKSLDPIREHFKTNQEAKKLYDFVKREYQKYQAKKK